MNMVEIAKQQVAQLTTAAYEKAAAAGILPEGQTLGGNIEIPKDTSHGDYASSCAMAGAKSMHMAPKAIAQAILDNLDLEGSYFEKAEIAGPGFLNFYLGNKWYQDVLTNIADEKEKYGCIEQGHGEKVMVEFVSANPTGPMHMGNARGGVLGDSLAEVFARAGYDAYREFYVNDAGNQIHKFAVSIDARYRQLIFGEENVVFPEDGYQGADIRELAQAVYDKDGDSLMSLTEEERMDRLAEYGLSVNIPKMQEDLKRYQIEYDKWFFESELHNSGYVAESIGLLTDRGWTYEKDGALWLKTADLLREKFRAEGKSEKQIEKLELKDDVLRRANGFYTYFAADIAYHRNKLEKRGFDKTIDVWGADHHGHVARLQAALDGLGLDGSHRLIVVLMQLVNLLRDGEAVRMSKRTGKAIALHDLLDEISVDAARYFFNSRASDSHLDFDLGVAVRQDSENPVYYVQYAHARICTMEANLAGDGNLVPAAEKVDFSLLDSEVEKDLIKALAQLPEEIRQVTKEYDPSRITRYVTALAANFHSFYNAKRIRGEEQAVLDARLMLTHCVRQVLENCLDILGITAPERM